MQLHWLQLVSLGPVPVVQVLKALKGLNVNHNTHTKLFVADVYMLAHVSTHTLMYTDVVLLDNVSSCVAKASPC